MTKAQVYGVAAGILVLGMAGEAWRRDHAGLSGALEGARSERAITERRVQALEAERARPAPEDLSQRLAEAERRLSETQAKAQQANAQAEGYKAILQAFSEEHSELRAQVEAALEKEKGRIRQDEKAEQDAFLRSQIEIGKDLPDAVVLGLGLQPLQRDALNQLMHEEGKRMYAHLRALAAEEKITAPPEDGPGVLLCLGERVIKDVPKLRELFQDPEVEKGSKTVYLEDSLGPDACMVRLLDGLGKIRQETLEAAGSTLDAGQRGRLRQILAAGSWYSFGGANVSLPAPNVLPRRPR